MQNDTTELNLDEAVKALHKFIEDCGSRNAAAAKLGISRVYLWRMAQKERPLSEAVLSAIGYERVVKRIHEYRKVS